MSPSRSARPDAVLMCGPWPYPRHPIRTVIHDLAAVLHRTGRSVAYLCEAGPLAARIGPDTVCFMELPADEPFDWRAAFAAKLVYPSLTAFLAADRHRRASLLGRVAVIHTHLDQLVFGSGDLTNSKHFDRTLSGHVAARTGRRPELVRTRHDDVQGNLDGFMRLTGIDFIALDEAERGKLLRDEIDLRPVVAAHVGRHDDLMRLWGWDGPFRDKAIHHVWWRLHQLFRWREEVARFDAVVCLTPGEVGRVRDLLLCDGAENLTSVPNGISFVPRSRAWVDQLLYDYHHQGLRCYRGAGADLEAVSFTPEDRKVVFVGRPTAAKGVYELAASLGNLYHSGRRVRGILVGGFGPELRRELAALDPASARDYLLFPGPVEDVDALAALWAFGDVTAIPSHYDTFPLVGLESYRMGTPCVVTEGTGAGEVYLANPRRHGIDIGLSVRRRHRDGIMRYYGVDVESLTEQLAFLIDHPLVARRLAEDGERFVREHYSAERMGAQYSALYDLLLDGGPACRLHG